MLLVVSPNLAMDRILEVHGFRPNEVQRSRSVISQPGGKGSNVARVFRQLGGEVVLIGFAGRRNADWIRQPLQSMGVRVEAIEGWDGESRTCTIICDGRCNTQPTVINEESSEVEPQAIEAMESRIDELLPKASVVLVTGSLSRGLSEDFCASVIRRASARQIVTAIDAAGPALRHGLQAKPTLVKANLQEISGELGALGSEPLQIANSLQNRSDLPAQTIVTLGEAGAILVTARQSWYAKPPRISHVNPIGAGDAFAAGYIRAYVEGSSPKTALQFATAVAASDAATVEPGWINFSEVTSLVSETQVYSLTTVSKT